MINKYNNGKIYKITSEHTENVYVGSTTRDLNGRLKEHRKKYKLHQKDSNKHDYLTSFEIVKYDTYEITLIENFCANTKQELLDREGHYIKITPNCVNARQMGRTEKEWRVDNKEYLQEKNKKYNQDHKVELSQYHKQYRTDNADEIKKKMHNYHEAHKEVNNAKKKQHVDCECGMQYSAGHKTRHFATERHKTLLNEKLQVQV